MTSDVCAFCGKKGLNDYKGQYCSKYCYLRGQRGGRTTVSFMNRVKTYNNYPHLDFEKLCGHCAKPFTVRDYLVYRHGYPPDVKKEDIEFKLFQKLMAGFCLTKIHPLHTSLPRFGKCSYCGKTVGLDYIKTAPKTFFCNDVCLNLYEKIKSKRGSRNVFFKMINDKRRNRR